MIRMGQGHRITNQTAESRGTMRENDTTAALQSRMAGQRRTAISRPEYGRRFAGFMGLVQTAR